MDRDKLVTYGFGSLIFVVTLAAYVILKLKNADTTDFLVVIPAAMAAITGGIAVKKMSNVEKQTNGPLTKGLEQVSESNERLSLVETDVSAVKASVEIIQTDFNTMKDRVNHFLDIQEEQEN